MKKKIAPYIMCIIILLFCVLYAMYKFEPNAGSKYVMTIVILWMVFLYLLLMTMAKKKVPFEKICIVFIALIGILYFIFMPRFSVPDEDGHFMRSYEISVGNFLSENNALGGHSLVPDGFEIFQDYPKTGGGNVYRLQRQYNKNVISDELHEVFNPNQALYSPFAYIPQSLGIFIARMFTKNAAAIFYSGRFAMFVFALFVLYHAIKLIPAGKRTILILCAFPMFMQEMISYSCDALINVSSIFLLAYVLYVSDKKSKITAKDKLIITATCFIIAMCKIVYLPLVFAVFMIPKEKFENNKRSWRYKIFTTVISIMANLLWLAISSSYLVETNPGVNPFEQVKYVITNPFIFIATIIRTIIVRGPVWVGTMAGCRLGSINIGVSYAAIICILLVLTVDLFIKSKEEKYAVSNIGKFLTFFVLLVIVMLIFASLYVQWTPYKKNIIDGIQGRYYIPLICWFSLLLNKKKIDTDNIAIIKIYLPVLIIVNFCAITSIYTFFSGSV